MIRICSCKVHLIVRRIDTRQPVYTIGLLKLDPEEIEDHCFRLRLRFPSDNIFIDDSEVQEARAKEVPI